MSLVFKIVDESLLVSEVFPANGDIIFTDELEKDQVFTRKKINPLVFIGDDYELLKEYKDLNDCGRLELEIYHKNILRWTGSLNLAKGQDDPRKCRLEISAEPLDEPSTILITWEKKTNIFSAASTIEAFPFIGEIECEECTLAPVADPPNFPLSSLPLAVCDPALNVSEGWVPTRNEVNGVEKVSDVPLLYQAELMIITRYCREFVAGATLPPGSGWVAVSGGFARTVVTVYDTEKSDTDVVDQKLLQYYNVVGLDTETGDQQSIDNGVLLNDLINYFVLDAGLTGTISDFLNINPDGTAPGNTAYTASNPNLHYLALFQKSDVKRPRAYQNATRAEVTFKELLDMLREVLGIYWIVENGFFRLEHLSYFEEIRGLNLVDLFLKNIDNLNATTGLEDKLAAVEKYNWSDGTQIRDFAGLDIEYQHGCADPSLPPVVHSAGQFYTDIQTAQRQPEMVSDNGLILANLALYDGKYYFIQETGELSGSRWVNGHLAWANLHENYHRWGRTFSAGTMNGLSTTFESTQKLEQQQDLKFPQSLDEYFTVRPEQTMLSQVGWGKPSKLIYSVRKCLLAATLNH